MSECLAVTELDCVASLEFVVMNNAFRGGEWGEIRGMPSAWNFTPSSEAWATFYKPFGAEWGVN